MGYVHLERVGARTFTFASTPFDTGSGSSSSPFRTPDTSTCVDGRRRVGPGTHALRALFSLPLSFIVYHNAIFISFSVCAFVLFFSFFTVLFFLLLVRFSIVIPLRLSNLKHEAGLPTSWPAGH